MSPSIGWFLILPAIALLVLLFLLSQRVFKAAVLAGAFAVCLVTASAIEWNAPLTPLVVVKLTALYSSASFIFFFVRQEWRIWNGLDQWPNPRGRYYDRWLALPPENKADYYPWLAQQKGWREPWASWASWLRMEREIDQRQNAER